MISSFYTYVEDRRLFTVIKVVGLSGYKAHELGIFNDQHPGIPMIKKTIEKRLVALIDQGLEWVVITGQLGIELWAGEVVAELREQYPDLKLAVLTPFLDQEEKWNEANQELYHFVLSQADYVNSITDRKYENPSQFKMKNRFLVEKCDAILLVYDQEKEGSPKYLYGESRKHYEKGALELLIITPEEIEDIARVEMESDPDYWMQ